ncbi:MAG TPA: aminotransferase class IV [bacterium]|nr:aminotransferase class IV [bacterium]
MKYAVYSDGRRIDDAFLLGKFLTEDIGVFETLRVYSGKIFRLEEHLRRLEESARTAGFSTLPARSRLRKELGRAIALSGQTNAFIRLTLIQDKVLIFIGQRSHRESLYQKGVCLQTTAVRRSLSHSTFPEAKTTAYQNGIFASLEIRPERIDEWVFLDRDGYVTEVRIGNLFMVRSSFKGEEMQLWTPPLTGILNGVTRRFVIECASDLGISTREAPLTRHDIYNASEAFLTNTSWEILPVRELDGRVIGSRIPGKLTWKLHQLFKKKVEKECQTS